jgi:hypothetical protein
MPLTDRVLLELCSARPEEISPRAARDTVETLGAFGLWSLNPEILRRAAGFYRIFGLEAQAAFMEQFKQPKLPKTQGACWVIVAVQNGAALPALRPAFPIPLQWDPNKPHDSRLPKALRAIAEDVVTELAADRELHGPSVTAWGLRLTDECGFSAADDLSQLDCLTWDSGWVPMAAGLITAIDQGLPDPEVWATGGWNHGVRGVGAVQNKAQAAVDFGARALYVPSENLPDLAASSFGPLEIAPLSSGSSLPRTALEPYLNKMKVQPGPSASREQCVEYYLHLRSHGRAEQFYEDRLRPFTALQLRGRLREMCSQRFTSLLTVVSHRPATVLLAVEAIEPRRVVLFYTPEGGKIESACREVVDHLTMKGLEPLPVPVVDDVALRRTFADQITALNADAAEIIIDLTPGTKWMTLALSAAAPKGSYLVYWWHRVHRSADGDIRILPGTETPFLWRKGSGFNLEPVGPVALQA